MSITQPGRVKLIDPQDINGLENRQQIEHVVVLMLENRSFDHMLGYLSLPTANGGAGRSEVDGLKLPSERDDKNLYDGNTYRPFPLGERTQFDPAAGPDHSAFGIDEQLANDCGGFVSNYAATRPKCFPADDLGLVMGYYTGAELYAYDFLARNFCVSDRWFCSTPGSTMPNRLYSVTGRCARSRNNSIPPVYSIPSIVEHLEAAHVDWAWFSHEPFASLWAIDLQWAVAHPDRAWEHLHGFDEEVKRRTRAFLLHLAEQAVKNGLVWAEKRLRELLHPHRQVMEARPTLSFGERHGGETFRSLAEDDNLPQVSFIDPLFVDVGPRLNDIPSAASNDDHPPSNVLLGQKLVADTVSALVESPAWERTLLLITYDEHGGFFDHVQPPAGLDVIADDDPDPQFHRLGPRVPAFVVSPRVKSGSVAPRDPAGEIPVDRHYDHTSVLKTILTRFCLDEAGLTIPDMGARVTNANHVLDLLDQAPRSQGELDGYDELIKPRSKVEAAEATALTQTTQPQLTDLQREYHQARATVLSLQRLAAPALLRGIGPVA